MLLMYVSESVSSHESASPRAQGHVRLPRCVSTGPVAVCLAQWQNNVNVLRRELGTAQLSSLACSLEQELLQRVELRDAIFWQRNKNEAMTFFRELLRERSAASRFSACLSPDSMSCSFDLLGLRNSRSCATSLSSSDFEQTQIQLYTSAQCTGSGTPYPCSAHSSFGWPASRGLVCCSIPFTQYRPLHSVTALRSRGLCCSGSSYARRPCPPP